MHACWLAGFVEPLFGLPTRPKGEASAAAPGRPQQGSQAARALARKPSMRLAAMSGSALTSFSYCAHTRFSFARTHRSALRAHTVQLCAHTPFSFARTHISALRAHIFQCLHTSFIFQSL
jgi:hypothetical protein